MAKCEPWELARAAKSARHLVKSACIVIAPKDYACLPREGLGVDTHVHQIAPSEATRSKLYDLAVADPEVDAVLLMASDDVVSVLDLDALPMTGPIGIDSVHTPVLVRVPRNVESSP